MTCLYLIPNMKHIEQSVALAEQYHCAFEYNDFFHPEILEHKDKCKEIINFYKTYRSDFSQDTMHGAFFDITLHSSDPRIREVSEMRIRQSMDIAADLGLKAVIFHTGRIHGFRQSQYIENWIQKNEAFFRKILEEYSRQEVYIENMFDEAPDILKNLAERMADQNRFGVCLDYAHAAVFGTELSQWVQQLAPYIKHIHVNDNYLGDDDHLTMGAGYINWEQFTRQMKNNKIGAPVLIEVHSTKAQENSLRFMEDNHIYPL